MPDQSSAATEHAILQEITQPLYDLPEDPLATIHADFAVALRGYERVAVDEYVRHTRRLVAELQATRSPEAAVRRALERVGEQISGILQRAHETAEQITAQSRSEAEDRLEQARAEAAQIAAAAERRVSELDADTDRIWLERQRIVADAEDLAGQLLALARSAAQRFPDDDEDAARAPGTSPSADRSSEPEAGARGAARGFDAEPDDPVAEPPEYAVADRGASVTEPLVAQPETEPPIAEPERRAAEPEVRAVEPEPPEFEPVTRVQTPRDDLEPPIAEPERPRDSETERTVAFHPLVPGDREDDDDGPAGERPAPGGRSPSVIPPASQAAHRRFWR